MLPLQAHGWLMVVGWGVLIPLGILTARHAKRWDPLWFHVHRWAMLCLPCSDVRLLRSGSTIRQYQQLTGMCCRTSTLRLCAVSTTACALLCTFTTCRAVQILGLSCALSGFIIIFV